MHPALHALATAQSGVVTAAQGRRIGVAPDELARLVRAGELVRLRQGAYVDAHLWQAGRPSERFLLRCRAALAARPAGALARHAALAAYRLPLHDVDLERVDLVGPVRRPFRRSGVVTLPAAEGLELARVGDLRCVPVAVAAVGVTIASGLEAGLVGADAAAHRGLVTRDALAALCPPPGQLGHRRVTELLAHLDPRCESPGETRTRLLLRGLGFAVRTQVVVRRAGHVVARVDFLVEGRVVVEFDGAVKYDGVLGRDALVAEKRREDALRAGGFAVVRLTWADLADPASVARRVRAALAGVR